jgi:hypothetical protein
MDKNIFTRSINVESIIQGAQEVRRHAQAKEPRGGYQRRG